jgi:hypothetical protein
LDQVSKTSDSTQNLERQKIPPACKNGNLIKKIIFGAT